MTMVELMPFSVLVPLIASAVCALLPGRFWPWALTMAAALHRQCRHCRPGATGGHDGTLSYAFGNWPPPIGIEYRVDARQRLCRAAGGRHGGTITLPWAKTSVDRGSPSARACSTPCFCSPSPA
jgi:multicomponent Na+:H+ antiporter subunit D